MELPKRLENAVTKLYNAFHKGELNAMDCKHCAVGNICDNDPYWGILTNNFNDDNLSYIIDEDVIMELKNSGVGYNTTEIANIEKVFLISMGYCLPFNAYIWEMVEQSKENQFKGLCAVIEYLCELDNVPNVMEIQSLFDYDDLGAVNDLKTLVNA